MTGVYAQAEGWSAVEAVGPDAGKFLQNFCTNDVLRLAEGQSCEAMFTNVKAHVLAYTWVARAAADRFVVLLSSGRADRLQEHLDRYLIRERVDLKLVPPDTWTVGVGLRAPLCVPVEAFGGGVAVALDSAEPTGQRLGAEEFERLRVRLGVPRDGVDVDDRNLPQEVDRNDRAISFTKGCYLGQEPVARIDALGRVNWLLRGVDIAGPPPTRGDELAHDGKPVGRVTSSIAEGDGSIALAYVRREHGADGSELSVHGAEAVVRTLPR